jgi:carboxyl-terminal processing protease
MRRPTVRSCLAFVAGAAAAALVLGVTQAGSSEAARYEDLNLFTTVLHLVQRNYVEPVDEHTLVQGAVRGMLAELDPHSSYMDPEQHREMQIDTRGEFHGIGIEISKRRDGYIEVVAPIDGTPAARAGIKAKDRIVAICPTEKPAGWTEPCHSTKNMSLFDAVKLMRGKRGTKITIRVWRAGFERPEPFTIARAVVKVESVEGRVLEPGYGYVRVRSFQERTADDLEKALARIDKESGGKPKGMVLDLRDDPGGLLDQAVRVADVWLSKGLIVYTKGRVEGQQQEFKAHADGTEPDYPLVVLVNAGSASASEIVAGALQDQGRALLLGEHTFGKGSVQTVYPLEDGSGLRLTTALYYTPSGRSIQEVGITPDITVATGPQVAQADQDDDDDDDGAHPVREKDLEHHFLHEQAQPGSGKQSAHPQPLELSGAPDSSASAEKGDVQLARAVEVLKSWTYFERLRARGGAPEARVSASAAGANAPATP